MRPIERQLLNNQVEIMEFLLYPDSPSNNLFLQKSETHKLLRLEESKEETACEIPKRLASKESVKGFFALDKDEVKKNAN